MRLGLSNFINGRPYLGLASQYETLIASPRELATGLHENKLDLSLLSTEAFWQFPEKLFTLPFGIAATNKTMSVLLFLRRPDDPLLKIAVPLASQTSVTLLQVILTHFWQRSFEIFFSPQPEKEEASGYLLIGDEALFHKAPYAVFDLATLWHQETALPFVFALYASRQEHPEMSAPLSTSLENFFINLEKEDHKEYFSCLNYTLESNHFRGMTLFHALRQELPCYH